MSLKHYQLIKFMAGLLPGVPAIIEFINSPQCTIEMINCDDKYTYSPLCLACHHLKTEIVEALIKKGVNVNQVQKRYKDSSTTPLKMCVGNNACDEPEIRVGLIDLLIKAGADINNDILVFACQCNDNASIRKLLEYTIDINYVDEHGKTAMDYLIMHENNEIMNLIEKMKLKELLETNLITQESEKTKMKI